ncbi:MAG: HdeD family acid-resistance protein [Candidatus Cryptobacteroides sp.]
MLPSRKIYMGITGAALVALGIICLSNPLSTVISLAWIVGILTLVSGLSTLLNWINLKSYFPQSGSILLSAILQILIGILFLRHDLALAATIPVIFAFFLIIEGTNLAIRSFDYRKIGFKAWWINLVLGLASTLLGLLSFAVPGLGGKTLSICIGIGLIVIGIVYFIALFAINRFDRRLNNDPWLGDVDEQ